MKEMIFELQKPTLKFLFEVNAYWQDYKKTKSILISKLKPLFWLSKANREFFFYRDPSRFFAYKILKRTTSKEEFIENFNKDFFKSYYNYFCKVLYSILSGKDIRYIHELYKDKEFPLLDDTYNRCLC